jgi:Zn-dependent protease
LEHKIVDFVIQLAVILFAISFHESAHAYAALRFGDTTARDLGRISLNPIRHLDPFGSVLLPIMLYVLSSGRFIFGAAKPTPVDLRNTQNPRLANLVVSAAGPVSNFVLAATGIVLLVLVRIGSPDSIIDLAEAVQGQRFAPGALAPIVYLLWNFVVVNMVLAVFNLIPIPPLDGSGILLSLGGAGVGRVFQTIRPFGFLILILLISTPFLSWIFRPFYLLARRLVFGV